MATTKSLSRDVDARWLDAPELEAWLALAGLMTRLPALLDAQLQRDADLSFFDYTVLAALSGVPEHTLQMSELATMTSSSLSRLSHAVSRMERQGYMTRSRRASGVGRATNATLTKAGAAKIRAAAPGHVRTVRALLFDALTKRDVEALVAIGQRVRPRLDPLGTWPHAP